MAHCGHPHAARRSLLLSLSTGGCRTSDVVVRMASAASGNDERGSLSLERACNRENQTCVA